MSASSGRNASVVSVASWARSSPYAAEAEVEVAAEAEAAADEAEDPAADEAEDADDAEDVEVMKSGSAF
ncbi:hypothetical protein OG883_29600 [Streptomyces sp. NBC_01142]|uniref:hypothetical protein n=1 Tax=Streptomyces sp. NBC_01142 TaxID=2975865 RepID=UPI002258809F|nr:hypothetical protein [Streptomyces sp. NBC_01142]MCX4823957.1 hypothetical protein [Streptomyces sp. NBC_01142]